MLVKIISSILDVVQSKTLDVSKDLSKDEKTSASIKEIFDNDKKEKENK
jgi:hypothetical protein